MCKLLVKKIRSWKKKNNQDLESKVKSLEGEAELDGLKKAIREIKI